MNTEYSPAPLYLYSETAELPGDSLFTSTAAGKLSLSWKYETVN